MSFDFGCSCGNAEQGADKDKHNISRTASPYDIPKFRSKPGSGYVHHQYKVTTRSRIVGGYQPKTRPWMVLLELKHSNGKRNSQCGGSIINKVTLKYATLFGQLKKKCIFSVKNDFLNAPKAPGTIVMEPNMSNALLTIWIPVMYSSA